MKKNRLSLKKNFSWTFLGNVIYAISQWGILVVLAKIGNIQMIGQFTLGLAITAPIFLFCNMQLRNIQATDVKDEYTFSNYYSLRIISSIVSCIIILIIVFVINYSWETKTVIIIMTISKVIESYSDIFYGVFQRCERMDFISISLITKGIVTLIVFSMIIFFTNNLIWGLIGYIFVWFVVFHIIDRNNAKKILGETSNVHLYIDWNRLNKLTQLAIPLGIVGTLDSLNLNIPRYFIQHYNGEISLGYFSAIAYIMVAGGTLIGALAQASTSRLATYYEHNLVSFKKLLKKLLFISILIGLTGVVVSKYFGKELLSILYNNEFREFYKTFFYIMIASAFWYIAGFLSTSITAARHLKIQVPLFIITLLSTLISSYYLIPLYNILGASLSLCIGMAIRMIFSSIILIKILKFKKNINPEGVRYINENN